MLRYGCYTQPLKLHSATLWSPEEYVTDPLAQWVLLIGCEGILRQLTVEDMWLVH